MKTQITSFLLFCSCALFAQQNLVSNGTFENVDAADYIVTDKGTELFRLGKERNLKTEITYPILTDSAVVANNKWYKVGNASGYNRCLIATEEVNQNKYLNIVIAYNSNAAEVNAIQRIGAIDPTKKYDIAFKARKDNSSDLKGHENYLSEVIVGLIDLKQNPTTEEPGPYASDLKRLDTLTISPNWDNYSLTIDIPAWKEKMKNKYEMTGESMGLLFTIKATHKQEGLSKLQWHGVDLDDIEMKEVVGSGIGQVKTYQPFVSQVNNGIRVEVSTKELIEVYALTGQLVFKEITQQPIVIPLTKGVYFVKKGNQTQKVIIK